MGSPRLAASTLAMLSVALCGITASAQDEICINRYHKSTDARALGFTPSDIEDLVSKEANAIGLSSDGIEVIPCDGVNKVRSNYISTTDTGVHEGDYILYDPVWVREVLGTSISVSNPSSKRARDEATFLFGHELGHLLGRHFTSNKGLSRLKKETQADRFAGCAAGALGADWTNISSFISRIRGDKDSDYPSSSRSLGVAKAQFDICRARGFQDHPRYTANGSGPYYSPPRMNGRTLDGCLISPNHPSGDDCSIEATGVIATVFCKMAGYFSAEDVHTTFFSQRQTSYKLTQKLTSNGGSDYIWNEDDGGGFEIASLKCKNLN